MTQGSNLCLLHCRGILYTWATRETLGRCQSHLNPWHPRYQNAVPGTHAAALSNSEQHPETRSGAESLNRTPVACRSRVGPPGSRLPVCAHGNPESGLWPPLVAGARLCPHLHAASTLLLMAGSTGLWAAAFTSLGLSILHPVHWPFFPSCLLGSRFQCKQPLILSSSCVFSSLQSVCSPSATCHARLRTSAPAPCSPHTFPLCLSASSGHSGHSPGTKAGRVRSTQLGHLSETVSLWNEAISTRLLDFPNNLPTHLPTYVQARTVVNMKWDFNLTTLEGEGMCVGGAVGEWIVIQWMWRNKGWQWNCR